MIKLFLITLLCVAVLADSPVDFNQMAQAGKEMVDQAIMAGQALMDQGSSLMQGAADPPQGSPPQGPPRGQPKQQ